MKRSILALTLAATLPVFSLVAPKPVVAGDSGDFGRALLGAVVIGKIAKELKDDRHVEHDRGVVVRQHKARPHRSHRSHRAKRYHRVQRHGHVRPRSHSRQRAFLHSKGHRRTRILH